MSNHGTCIVSMANVCRWLATAAEEMGVEIFPGMACSELVLDGDRVPGYEPGMELRGKYVFLAEGVRGSLSKQAIARYRLSDGHEPQTFGLGMKEIYQAAEEVSLARGGGR